MLTFVGPVEPAGQAQAGEVENGFIHALEAWILESDYY